eukprot:SAG11_NODE_939_length_6468_cov_4.629926_2_plen_62_part_00
MEQEHNDIVIITARHEFRTRVTRYMQHSGVYVACRAGRAVVYAVNTVNMWHVDGNNDIVLN